jgi:hypothetical protein
VNRLEDSILLWRSVVSNRLLANVNIIVFLNKCDLLQRKLAAGVRFANYMTSYGDRPNDFDSVSKCASARCRHDVFPRRWLTGSTAQTSGISSAHCSRSTPRTRSASCTVRAVRSRARSCAYPWLQST